MVLAFGVQQLLSTDGTVTFGSGQMPGSLQPGPVLLSQRLPLPDRVIAGLPDLIAGTGFGLPGAGQLGLGGMNKRCSALTGPVAFSPRRLSGPGGLRDLPGSAGLGGLSIGVSTSDRLGQLPFGGKLAIDGDARIVEDVKQLVARMDNVEGGTRLGGDRPRLRAAPGRFRLGQLHGHHLRVQRRDLPACQRDQRTRLPDQRRQRAKRVTGLLR